MKIEDNNIQNKIKQRIKQLEFLVYNKRSNWIDSLNFKQFTDDIGSSQISQSPSAHNSLEKSDPDRKKNIFVSSIFSRIFNQIKNK